MRYTYNKQMAKDASRAMLGLVTAAIIITMSLGMLGATQAKELASGAPAPKPACADVKNLSYKGDARVGELGFAQIDITYSVSPCDRSVPVRVAVSLTRNIIGSDPVYIDENASQSGKFTVNGVLVNTSYIAKVTVYNASTGVEISSSQIFAAANRKVGV